MKKKIGITFVSVSIIFIVFLLLNYKEISYEINVSDFEEIKVEDLEDLSKKEDTLSLYIGRKTCPFCREFVPKLKSSASNNNTKIYYIDSEDKEDEVLNDYREINNIETVPALLKVNNNNVESIMDSTLSEEEITDFLMRK